MSEVSHKIRVKDFCLEALYEEGLGTEAVVLCHPHPLYGGDMDNNVISAMRKAMLKCGWSTLRFNFRGVGGSGGAHGEGEGEVEDVMAAVSHLKEHSGKAIHFAGYSFGAWIALKAVREGVEPGSMVLVSPPLDLLSFEDLALPTEPCLIVVGDRDGFCRVGSLERWVASRPQASAMAEIKIISGCDHFHWGFEEALDSIIIGFLKRRLRSCVSGRNHEQAR